MKNKNRLKVSILNILAIGLFFVAVAWNIKLGGIYNLEIGIGALFLGIIKIWQEY